MPTAETCAAATRIVHAVTKKGQSLDRATFSECSKLKPENRGEVREISWGTLRWWFRYQAAVSSKLNRPISKKDQILESLLLCGAYQLDHLNEPDYAVTSGTVEAARVLGLPKAVGLVNGVLRSWLRDKPTDLMSSEECTFATPSWLLQRIKSNWPDEWQKVVSCANQKPPMTLRVNTFKITRSEFIELLARENIKAHETSISPWGVTLEKPRDISSIPGFSLGFCSVQDEAAQMAPLACLPFNGGRVLDACAAPGGKTTHLIEALKNIESVTAIDLPNRTKSISDNLDRLDQSAKVISADILNDKKWCDEELYDLILLDAPCSGTGVIKRHPDIRHHRRSSDIATYALQQSRLLSTLWPLLRTGGQLVYVTCSILKEENDVPIDGLIQKFSDVQVRDITIPTAIGTKNGQQLLPNDEHDGLFYASLAKA